jgi:hypothetical protein
MVTCELSALRLTNGVLPSIDGITGLLDKDKIHKSVFTGQMLMIFMNGGNPKSIPMDSLEFEGKRHSLEKLLIHKFKGEVYSLKALAELEEAGKPADKAALKDILKKLKQKFHVVMSLNLQEALGTKKMVLPLIKESCQKRNRPDSLLIKWGEVKEGREHESLEQNVTSLKIFYVFCTDLLNFLKDIVESCPKARKQYEEWKKHQAKA